MKKESFIVFIILTILTVSISGCVDDTDNSVNSNQTLQKDNSSAANVKITSDEAKNIAKKYLNKSGATLGEPLLKTEGDKVYIIPIIVNGNNAGEILIDAQTGENKGAIG